MDRAIIAKFIATESGATSIEYALIGAIISICIVFSVSRISSSLEGVFNTVSSSVQANSK